MSAFHLLRVEYRDERLRVTLDGSTACWEGSLARAPKQMRLDASDGLVEFVGLGHS
mgnify:CR=1 FL=1